jgi:hypothetical protein
MNAYGINFGLPRIEDKMRASWKRQSAHMGRNRYLQGATDSHTQALAMIAVASNGRRQMQTCAFRFAQKDWIGIVEVWQR